MTYTKFNPLQFESELELLELLRDKSKDFRHKENKEFRKFLEINRHKHEHKVFITSSSFN